LTEYISWYKFELGMKKIAEDIKISGKEYTGIYGIPRGGLIPAVRLSHLLGIPLTTILDEDTLVVDDVADTGATLLGYETYDKATLYWKPDSEIKPEYYAFTTREWVVMPWEEK